MTPRTFKLARTIEQQPDGRWLVKEWGRYFKSPTGALKALNREITNMVHHNRDVTVVQQLTWLANEDAAIQRSTI